jgi:predicted phage terminase large subunit-like protein
MLDRMDAEESLIAFTEWTFSRYRTAEHHRLIAAHLERVERGEIDRLILHVPPRHGKSELASVRFPAWYLGRHPDKQLISVSAEAGLAGDFGRQVRNLINSREYRAVFNTQLAEDSQARGKWHTTKGGFYYAIGVGGSVLGRGGDIILIDDPFASMEDAQSELQRKRVWDWYTGTAYNRLQPGAAIVVINHRMHEDDLSGMLLRQQAAGGDRWTVVELPAVSEANEALWPEAYPLEALERIRNNTLPRFWSALYQQRPAPEEGTFFKREWFRPYAKPPAREALKVFAGSDYAMTADGGDYTVHAVVGVDTEDNLWLLDLYRAQSDPRDWVERFCDLVKEWKPIAWAEENVQITSGIGPYLESRQRVRKAWCAREQFPTRGDKAFRCQSFRGRMALSGLYVPTNAPWYPDFEAELLGFPAGKHDDQVDACGLVGQLLDIMLPPQEAEKPKPKKPRLDWFETADDDGAPNWKTL